MALQEVAVIVGEWSVTLSDAWFLEPPGTVLHGRAVVEWLDDGFLVMRSTIDGEPGFSLVIGRSDPDDTFAALYHDPRGISRRFHMTFIDRAWTLSRQDPDFYQRFVADVGGDHITGRWEASEDQGQTWRKDYDLRFERA